MPLMNGTRSTKIIRETGFTGKIYGVTGNVFSADVQDFLDHGVDRVYCKPLSSQQYSDIIDSLI
jgi:CheY-like chemotaxis protein